MFKRTKSINQKWADNVRDARYFVVLTDQSSCINLQGADPSSFEDENALISQATMIRVFLDRLTQLLAEHDQVLEDKFNVKPKKAKKIVPKKAASKAKKINVKVK